MAKEYTGGFYKSKAWIDCRSAYIAERIKADGGVCEMCHDRLGFIVHHKVHITPLNIGDANITLSHDNLMYVCHQCHDAIHYADIHNGKERAFCMFTEDGQPISLR